MAVSKLAAAVRNVKHPPRDALLKQLHDKKVHKASKLHAHDARKSGFIEPHVSHRPWGYERWLTVSDSYCMKELHLKKGGTLSIQSHPQKHETLTLVMGKCRVLLGKQGELDFRKAKCYEFSPGDVVRIEPNTIHTFQALSDSLLFEASLPLPGEHHTVRHHDFYGRK